jgi:beta-mannosidase
VPRADRLGHLLRLARDANVNLLRIWGGGLIESEAFYDACDTLGILVWQEFSQSSSGFDSTPSTDPAFVEALAADARAIVPLRRNHPSLAVWCGGNELEDAAGPLDDARSPALAALHEVVAELDPDRAWLPTSPTGPQFANRLDVIAADPDALHDVHGPWEHQGLGAQERLYDAGTSLLNSEFGVEGMASRRSLEALVEPDHRWPPTRANPVYRHLGDWWINEPLVQSAFGGRLHDLDEVRRASRWLQAEGLRYAVEANRRRWPRNSGSIPWQLNESFPNAWCTSAVEWRGDPKPGYFAVADAYRNVHVCASYTTSAWGGNDAIRATAWAWSNEGAMDGEVATRLLEIDGAVAAEATWPVGLRDDGRAVRAGELVVTLGSGDTRPVLLDLVLRGDGGQVVRSRVPFSRSTDLAPFLDVPRVAIDARCEAAGDAWRVELRNTGRVVALGLTLDDARPVEAPGFAEASDGWLHLLPGESATVDVRWADAPIDGRRLRIDGWNVEPRDGIVVE